MFELHGIKWKYSAQPNVASDLCCGEAPNAATALQTSAAVVSPIQNSFKIVFQHFQILQASEAIVIEHVWTV